MFAQNTKPHYEHLKDKWIARHKSLQEKLWAKHGNALSFLVDNTKRFALSSLAGLFLLGSQSLPKIATDSFPVANAQSPKEINKNVFLVSDLSHVLPSEVIPLTFDQEQNVSEILSRIFGFKVLAELDGKKLNRNYGVIGQEQHLALYPGDTMSSHFDNNEDATKYWSYGMAPGLGAWGYFSPSQNQLTQKDKLREKYYIAVQTFLIPDFNQRFAEYRDFFKYRKMLVVNPQNGKSVVADIADAGPSQWTGKHLGGSPEVMNYLEREDGSKRGPVLYFFIDDPQDKVALGPIAL
ncbi:MAG: hypothetical protein Q7R31_04960 [Candidatus Levybacteria bacterium]|nr:hypothetical protein [Candidatus Levybacteria bacterium]